MSTVPCSLLALRNLCSGELRVAWEKVGRGQEAVVRRGSEQKEL